MLLELPGRSFADRFDRMQRGASAVCFLTRAPQPGVPRSTLQDPSSARPYVPRPTSWSVFQPSLPRRSWSGRCPVPHRLHRLDTTASLGHLSLFGFQLPFTLSCLETTKNSGLAWQRSGRQLTTVSSTVARCASGGIVNSNYSGSIRPATSPPNWRIVISVNVDRTSKSCQPNGQSDDLYSATARSSVFWFFHSN